MVSRENPACDVVTTFLFPYFDDSFCGSYFVRIVSLYTIFNRTAQIQNMKANWKTMFMSLRIGAQVLPVSRRFFPQDSTMGRSPKSCLRV